MRLGRAAALSLLSAALLVAAHPFAAGSFTFLDGGGLAWIALVPLWLAVRAESPREAFRIGFASSFLAFGGTLFWLYVALHRFGHLSPPLSGALTLALCAWCALFPALAIAGARALEESGTLRAAIALPLLWAAAETVRGVLLTGFPWALAGHTQWRFAAVAQCAEWIGVPGLSAIVVLVNVALAELLATRAAPASRRLFAAAAAAVALMLGYGAWRVAGVDARVAALPTSRIALAQGNVTQDEKHDRAFDDEVRRRYAGELDAAQVAHAELEIWPEATIPLAVHLRSVYLPPTELAQPNQTWLVAGAATWWDEAGILRAHNSALLVAPGRRIAARYDKRHLVPFGEYVPLPHLLFFVHKITQGGGDFVPGDSPAPLETPAGRLGVLICYEDVFPAPARSEVRAGAELLAVLTNDAWYGHTSASWQHLAFDVFRAIETRRTVVRAGQTGVSAMVDAAGRVRELLAPFTGPVSLVVDAPRGAAGDAPYLALGDAFPFALVGAAAALTASARSSARARPGARRV